MITINVFLDRQHLGKIYLNCLIERSDPVSDKVC